MARQSRGLVLPALATGLALAILISLGVWQLHRREWKRGLLADIDQAEAAPPVPLVGIPSRFTKVVAEGTLRPGVSALYGAEVRDTPAGPSMGAQLLELLDRPGQPPLLVDLGWVPTDHGAATHPAGPARVTGFIRLPESPGWLAAADDLAGRHFYTLDAPRIAAALGAAQAAPMALVALGQGAAPDQPDPARALPRPPNNHFQYALTWFGLAASLLAVVGSLAWQRRREPRHTG